MIVDSRTFIPEQTNQEGVCRFCGEIVAEGQTYCSKQCRSRWYWSKSPFGTFHHQVGEYHQLGWLADRLGLDQEDDRLERIALKLAEAGKLVVYITRDGNVGEVGLPRKRP